MILSKSYDDIMNKIEVTDEMRQRVLNNIQTAQDSRPRIISLRSWKNIVAIAACFILLIAGIFTLPQLFNRDINKPPTIVAPSVKSFSSAKELSSACKFEVKEIKILPFTTTATSYRLVEEIAEIVYYGEDNSATYRISCEAGDNSGIYDDFDSVKTIQLKGFEITVKGFDDSYSLTVWQAGDFSCSLSFDKGISLEKLSEILLQLL